MSKIIKRPRYTVIHTDGIGTLDDISFQKSAWPMDKRKMNLDNAEWFCFDAHIKAKGNLAVVGFNQQDRSIREITEPDPYVFDKIDGNILITKTNVCLMAWASDCCLVALAGDDGAVVAVLHASVNTFKNGIIDQAITELRERHGVKDITAYVGICAGKCCYEYGAADAARDFADWPEFIIPSNREDKVYLDLAGAVRENLRRDGAEVIDIFEDCSCNICAKNHNGKFRFPSFRRDVDETGKHINGQYGLFICKKEQQ